MQLSITYLLTLALSALPLINAADPPALRSNAITSPVAGDTITAGQPYTIKWTNIKGGSVTLSLVDGPTNQVKPLSEIVANAPNNGAYTWNVPDDLPASNTYAIRITYDNKPENWNYSDRFEFDNQNVVPSAAVSSGTDTTTAAESTATSEPATATTETAPTSTDAESTTDAASTETSSPAATTGKTKADTTTDSLASKTSNAVKTNPAPLEGGDSSAATRSTDRTFGGLLIAFAGVLAGGAIILV